MSLNAGRAVSISRLLVVVFVLLGLYLTRDYWLPIQYRYRSGGPLDRVPQYSPSESHLNNGSEGSPLLKSTPATCRDVPGADNVMILLKTGATEIYQKLPPHFLTTFKCVPHFMIFSDLAQELADYPVYDAIENIGQKLRDEHHDFELYRKLQQYQREGQDMSKLQGSGSWDLDKWKFLPMLHKAFSTAGDNINWFVVMEADTSLSWTNLLQWLRTMDHTKPYYAGAQNVIGQTTFAHGGSGIIISRRAADMLEEQRDLAGPDEWDADWERRLAVSCCGDEVIARAFMTADIHLTPSWPLIQGETVESLDWKEIHWCAVAISWHHVSAIQLDSLWQFESDWIERYGWDTPYLFRDVFEHFVQRHVRVDRERWNNDSKNRKLVAPELATSSDTPFAELKDWEQNATTSREACVAACEKMRADECVQWMFQPGRCHLGRDIIFGKSDEGSAAEHWTSGWVQDRVEAHKERLKDCPVRWSG